jgi:tetratricopeptide (TPR) repeat protein
LCAVREFDEAFDVLQNTDLDPSEHPSLWAAARVWLGNLYYRRHEFAKALEQFEAVVDLPPEQWAGSRESLARMADCYMETGQPESALAVAEKAYRELRGNDLVHVEYAKALAIARRWREAEQVLRELNEETVDEGLKERFYAHSAYVAAGLHNRNSAEPWLRKLRELNPSSRYLPPLEAAIGKGTKTPKGLLHWFRGQD